MTVWQKIVDMPYLATSKYKWQIVGSAGIIGVLLAAGGSFWWYQRYQLQQASYSFVGALEDTERALRSSQMSQETINELEQAYSTGAQRYASTALAPFFEAFAAEMQIRKGNMAEALTTLQHALSDMSSSSPYYYLYATKVALLQMDSADEAVRAQGQKSLQELANTAKNPQQDMARYYLGLHEWSAGNHTAAKNTWSSLIEKSSQEKPSSWGRLAHAKLDLVAS